MCPCGEPYRWYSSGVSFITLLQDSYVSICIGYELAYALCSKLGFQALFLSMYICAKFLGLSLDLNIFSVFAGSI